MRFGSANQLVAALILLIRDQFVDGSRNILLITVSIILILLAVLMVREAVKALGQGKVNHVEDGA